VDLSHEFAIMRDGSIEAVFDSVEAARAALYRMSAPVGKHPSLVQRVRSADPQPWTPVPTALGSLLIAP
jgi:hypothetical protein